MDDVTDSARKWFNASLPLISRGQEKAKTHFNNHSVASKVTVQCYQAFVRKPIYNLPLTYCACQWPNGKGIKETCH